VIFIVRKIIKNIRPNFDNSFLDLASRGIASLAQLAGSSFAAF
jgi:hypothetical protein